MKPDPRDPDFWTVRPDEDVSLKSFVAAAIAVTLFLGAVVTWTLIAWSAT